MLGLPIDIKRGGHQMIKCPFRVKTWGLESSQMIPNPEYEAWHKGFEAYKLEMIKTEKKPKEIAHEMAATIIGAM